MGEWDQTNGFPLVRSGQSESPSGDNIAIRFSSLNMLCTKEESYMIPEAPMRGDLSFAGLSEEPVTVVPATRNFTVCSILRQNSTSG